MSEVEKSSTFNAKRQPIKLRLGWPMKSYLWGRSIGSHICLCLELAGQENGKIISKEKKINCPGLYGQGLWPHTDKVSEIKV